MQDAGGISASGSSVKGCGPSTASTAAGNSVENAGGVSDRGSSVEGCGPSTASAAPGESVEDVAGNAAIWGKAGSFKGCALTLGPMLANNSAAEDAIRVSDSLHGPQQGCGHAKD